MKEVRILLWKSYRNKGRRRPDILSKRPLSMSFFSLTSGFAPRYFLRFPALLLPLWQSVPQVLALSMDP